jgi:hypothetical protein
MRFKKNQTLKGFAPFYESAENSFGFECCKTSRRLRRWVCVQDNPGMFG